MKVKSGDKIMIGDALYCNVEIYKEGWLHFFVINGGWEGKLSDAGVMMIGKQIVSTKKLPIYVFLPGEAKGDYNEIIYKFQNRARLAFIFKWANFLLHVLNSKIKSGRIAVANWIDPRTQAQKAYANFDDDQIPF